VRPARQAIGQGAQLHIGIGAGGVEFAFDATFWFIRGSAYIGVRDQSSRMAYNLRVGRRATAPYLDQRVTAQPSSTDRTTHACQDGRRMSERGSGQPRCDCSTIAGVMAVSSGSNSLTIRH
jgi:hypothetical protein